MSSVSNCSSLSSISNVQPVVTENADKKTSPDLLALQEHFQALIRKKEIDELALEEILGLQEALTRSLVTIETDHGYSDLLEKIEAFIIQIFSSGFFHSIKSGMFPYEGNLYVVKPTKGEGSCALHALLGEEIEELVRFQGEYATSSTRAKNHYLEALQQALREKKGDVEKIFYEVLSGYLQLSDSDPSKIMLFHDNAEGRKILEHWTQLNKAHTEALDEITIKEANIWLSLIKDESTGVWDKILKKVQAVEDPSNPYFFKKNPETLLGYFEEQPVRILDQIRLKYVQDDSIKKQILELREQKEKLLEHQDAEKLAFILSDECTSHYSETIRNPAFFLDTNEIKLAANLFQKNVVIVASTPNGIEPTEKNDFGEDSEASVVIHHQGAHFSRCEIRQEESPSAFPSSQTDSFWLSSSRDTRSDVVSTGPMRVIHIDPETKVLEAEFLSKRDYEKYQRHVSQTLSRLGHYGIARHFGNPTRNVPALESLQKGAQESSRQLKADNNDEWGVWNGNAKGISEKSIPRREKTFEQAIADMKRFLKPEQFDPEAFFDAYNEAKELNPNSFIPYRYSLVLIPTFSVFFPETAFEILKEAYELSPHQTFNNLMFILEVLGSKLQPDEKKDRLLGLAQYFYQFFPDDTVGHILSNDLHENFGVKISQNSKEEEKRCRKGFAKSLGNGLTAFHEGNFDLARKEFSEAELYHISDKRPYMYKALIDLKNGDLPSASKLSIILHKLIDWPDPDSQGNLGKDLPPTQSLNNHLEAPTFKKVLRFFNSPNNEDSVSGFMEAMKDYLAHPYADLLWASAIIDMSKELLGKNENYSYLLKALIFICYKKLEYLGEDISKYRGEKENTILVPEYRKLAPESESHKICIDHLSFQIKKQNLPILLHQILLQKFDDLSLLRIENAENLDEIFSSDLSKSKSTSKTKPQLHGPFLSALFSRLEKNASLEEKCKFLNWANRHAAIWPHSHKGMMSDFILRQQLQQLVPDKKLQKFIRLGETWLSREPASKTSALDVAKKTLSHLREKQYAAATGLIAPFFQDWEDRLFAGIDTAALTYLCASKVLLEKPKYMQAMPRSANNKHHKELIPCALSILAREGVQRPLVIPNVEMTPTAISTLCRLYIGRQREESDPNYAKRLKKAALPNTGALHHVPKVHEHTYDTQQEWLFPTTKVQLLGRVRHFIERENALFLSSQDNNKRIQGEKPQYTEDTRFIQWVEEKDDLIDQYIKDRQQVINAFRKAFPKFSQEEEFITELEKKADHLQNFKILLSKLPTSLKVPERRFWQLVAQTADLIERIHLGRRNEVSYDMILQNKEEAHFCMQLIYEWSRNAMGGEIDIKFAKAFHGPETHVWGNGPRIPHFNAGVKIENKEKPKNVHLYFLE